jgi:hypothetical protein
MKNNLKFYGENFVVGIPTNEIPNENVLTKSELIKKYKIFVDGKKRQQNRIDRDLSWLKKNLSVNEKYVYAIKQYTGHSSIPKKINYTFHIEKNDGNVEYKTIRLGKIYYSDVIFW